MFYDLIANQYPWTNFHEMNLDWLLRKMKELEMKVNNIHDYGPEIEQIKEELSDIYNMIDIALCKDLVDTANYNFYGQVIPDTNSRFNAQMSSQGFCIGDLNGRPVALNLFIDGVDNTNLAVFTYMDDGTEITRYTLNCGHANSCTYSPVTGSYYIACGGGGYSGGLLEVTLSGATSHTAFVEGSTVWAVAYANESLYCLISGGFLVRCDHNFNTLEKYTFTPDTDFTYQGMFSDGVHLYIPNGNAVNTGDKIRNIRRITVTDFKANVLKQVYVTIPVEVEEGDFINDRCYVSCNTTNCALIFSMDLKAKSRKDSFGISYNVMDVNQNGIEVHVNEGYGVTDPGNEFFVDGSAAHPLSSLAWIVSWIRNYTDRINIKIDSDILQMNKFSLRLMATSIIDIDGQNHKMPNILVDMGNLNIKNCIFPGVDGDATIQFFGDRMVLNNVQFDNSDTTVIPSRFVFATGSYEIISMVINQKADFMVYLLGSGYIRSISGTLPGKYKMLIGATATDSSMPFDKIYMSNTLNQANISPIYTTSYNKTFSINDIGYPCLMRVATPCTINDLPAGLTVSDLKAIRIDRYVASENVDNTIRTYYKTDGTIEVEYYRYQH